MLNGRTGRVDLEERSLAPAFPLEDGAGDHPRTSWNDVQAGHLDGAEILEKAPPEELLRQQIALEHEGTKSVMKSGFILYRLWVTGAFQDMTMTPNDARYPWTSEGFYKFLHDHGSHLSPTEISARQKVYAAFIGFPLEIHRKVEMIGVNKARAAVSYVTRENVEPVLELCRITPYFNLRETLDTHYPGPKKTRNRKSPDDLKNDDHVRSMRVISSSETGRIGGIKSKEWIFIPRQNRRSESDEYRARAVFEAACRKIGNDRDAFFMQVVDLVAKHFLTEDEIRVIDNAARARAED